MIVRIALTLFLGASLAPASQIYSVQFVPLTGCGAPGVSLTDNGLIACSGQIFNSNTGTVAALPGILSSGYRDVMNADGEVAATAGYMGAAYFFNGSTIQSLPAPGGGYGGIAALYGIDSAGDILGYWFDGNNGWTVLWDTSGPTITSTILGPHGDGAAISEDGTVVYNPGTGDILYSIATGARTQIDSLSAYPNAVNDSGLVVGDLYGGWHNPYEASAGDFVEPCLIDDNCSGDNFSLGAVLNSVNSSGVAVGENSPVDIGTALLYYGGTFVDLNSLAGTSLNAALGGTGWSLFQALAINDSGQILAVATGPTLYDGGSYPYVLLTPETVPTPEPATLALSLPAITVLWLSLRRGRRTGRSITPATL